VPGLPGRLQRQELGIEPGQLPHRTSPFWLVPAQARLHPSGESIPGRSSRVNRYALFEDVSAERFERAR
jgi:hypothetical protein